MEEAAANAAYDAKYEGKFHDGTFRRWHDKWTPEFRFGHRDGLTIFVTSDKPTATPFWLAAPLKPEGESPAVE